MQQRELNTIHLLINLASAVSICGGILWILKG